MHLKGPTSTGLMYFDSGDDGPVVVLLHGVLMNGTVWNTVVAGLGDRYRCIVSEFPFGAHTTPMPDDADLSLPALATLLTRTSTPSSPSPGDTTRANRRRLAVSEVCQYFVTVS